MEDNKNSIFALKTSAGQERNVARLLAMKADKPGVDIVRHLRGIVGAKKDGTIDANSQITLEEVKKFLKPQPIISSIQKGSIVELVSGPFKGEKSKVVRLDESREDQIRIIKKEAD